MVEIIRPKLVGQQNGQKMFIGKDNKQMDESTANAEYNNQKQARYNEVYAHESAHLAAAGSLAGSGIVLEKNGQDEVTGGHVLIKTPSQVNKANPQKTYDDAKTARTAALAPASNLSDADLSVAAKAQSMMSSAKSEMDKSKTQNKQGEKVLGSKLDITA